VHRRILAALTALLLATLAVGCGSDADTSKAEGATDGKATGFPVTVTTPAGKVTLDERPARIVSMSPSATETLWAVGAGEQVVAVDKNSNFPTDVPKGDLDAYEPNVEAVIAKKPDLVVLSNDANDLVKSLQAVQVPVLLEQAPSDLPGVLSQVVQLGEASGHEAAGRKVAARIEKDLDTIVDTTDAKGVTYYHELDQSFYSQTSKTFIGRLLGRLGLVNIADGAGGTSDYPQLSAEHIIKTDPDLILLADTKCCQQSAEAVASRPGWASLKAVTGKHVVELDDDVASRWGPRVVELVRQVAKAAQKVKKAA
jgi:iron complex transport system substrate-binding protein